MHLRYVVAVAVEVSRRKVRDRRCAQRETAWDVFLLQYPVVSDVVVAQRVVEFDVNVQLRRMIVDPVEMVLWLVQ